jgi:hypothetical protein
VLTRDPEPWAVVLSIRARALDLQRAELAVILEIETPRTDRQVLGADYEILADGLSFAEGTTGLYAELKAGERAQVELPLFVAYHSLPGVAAARLRDGGTVNLVVRGALRAIGTGFASAIGFAGEVELALSSTAGP